MEKLITKTIKVLEENPYKVYILSLRKDKLGNLNMLYSEQLDIIEMRIISEINSETTSNGKKVYTNEELRKSELINRLEDLEDYQNLKQKKKNCYILIKKLEFKINFLSDEMSNKKAIVPLLVELKKENLNSLNSLNS